MMLSAYFPPPHVNREDLKALESDVARARRTPILWLSLAIGDFGRWESYGSRPPEGIGGAAIRAGADLVLGHHQHAYQGGDLSRKIICHGLGSFVFYPFAPRSRFIVRSIISMYD